MSQAQPAEGKRVQMAETTYFVMVSDDYEIKAAREYVKMMYPGTQAKVVHELRLDRLTDKHTVITLTRDNERTPAVAIRHNPQGIREISPTPVAELAKEVRESKPIAVEKYWAEVDGDGVVDLASFLTELGKGASPAAVKYLPSQGLLKLGFA